MKIIILFFGVLAIVASIKAEEGCTYGGITYPKGKSPIVGKCMSINCVGGDAFKISDGCAIASVQCAENKHYYETPYDYSKDYPECCPDYGCRE